MLKGDVAGENGVVRTSYAVDERKLRKRTQGLDVRLALQLHPHDTLAGDALERPVADLERLRAAACSCYEGIRRLTARASGFAAPS